LVVLTWSIVKKCSSEILGVLTAIGVLTASRGLLTRNCLLVLFPTVAGFLSSDLIQWSPAPAVN
jgi:hypothetical protein